MGTSPLALLLTCAFAESSATRGAATCRPCCRPSGLSTSLGPSPSAPHPAPYRSCSPGQGCGVGIPRSQHAPHPRNQDLKSEPGPFDVHLTLPPHRV